MRGPPFETYPANAGQVREAANATRNRLGRVQDMATDVEREHRGVVEAVEDDLIDSMRNAPTHALRTATIVHQDAEFAAGCLEWFAHAIDEFNWGRTTYPRSVLHLNLEWFEAEREDFHVQRDEGESDDEHQEQLDIARAELICSLRREFADLEAALDDDADEVRAMLERGPNTDDLQTLWRAGVLPPYAVLVYPDAGLEDVWLSEDVQREVVDYLIEHPDLLVDLPPALAAVVDGLFSDLRTEVYVEQRMEQLRREGLLTGDNPGARYEQWIRNTVENEIPIETVIDIAWDHGVRPSSFQILDGLREITDDDGKSFFVLNSDTTGDVARAVVLLTYILNAGPGYRDGDFEPTPYNSDELQRIRDRQESNLWSYNDDVDFVHSNGGTLVTTPNGMLMGAGGNWLQDTFSFSGGTTWGDIFMINEDDPENAEERLAEIIESGGEAADKKQDDLDRLLHHEEIHSQQWARYGYTDFALRYLGATTEGRGPFGLIPVPFSEDEVNNEYEQEAGLEDGGYVPEPEPERENEPDDGRDEEGDAGYEVYVDDEGMPRCEPYGHALVRETHLHLNPADEAEHYGAEDDII